MPVHPAFRRKALGFREKFTPFLTCLAILVLGPVCFYIERMTIPAKGHRATQHGHHVRTRDALTMKSAEKVWDYHLMHHELKPADVIAVFCSHDLRVADHAVKLYKERRLSPRLLFSGGFGTGPHSGKNLNGWDEPEAAVFAARAVALGVKREHIIVEDRATNTGENVVLTRALLEKRGTHTPREHTAWGGILIALYTCMPRSHTHAAVVVPRRGQAAPGDCGAKALHGASDLRWHLIAILTPF